MITIAKPYIGEEEKKAVMEVLDSGMLAQGPRVKKLEEMFTEYTGAAGTVAASSGTSSLHLSLLALGVGPGDEVITTPFTFFASASSIAMCGGKPVFADIQRDSFNIDPKSIEENITPKTKGIMPVHLYGQSADMDEIMKIAKEHDLFVLEDACQAHGAAYKGKKVGIIGDMGTFSLYPTKNMMAGEGGLITSNDEGLLEKVRLLRDHGSPVRYQHTVLGYNFRMTDICAAIAGVQLGRLEGFNKTRRENARLLNEQLEGVPGLTTPEIRQDRYHVFHQYGLVVEDDHPLSRDALVDRLRENGVGARGAYPSPLYAQEVFRHVPFGGGDCTVCEEVLPRIIEVPIHPLVSPDDIKYIANV
ncbi:MAG: DegT/DnrJ/EryC1/StrS family aminotransferase, partial [Thermoplasmata archaeon]|nr:DegT/DnrJ/EryC1/StrS family aminotransferase [Thermoplasmata archaeon]